MWLWLFGFTVGSAHAAPDLEIERGRVAASLERYGEARDLALEALRQAPGNGEAQDLYVDTTAAAGLGTRGLQELLTRDRDTPRWFSAHSALVEAVDSGDVKAAKSAAGELRDQFGGHPHLLRPLWDADSPKLAKLGDKLLKPVLSQKVLDSAELTPLYRLRRLLVEIGDTDGRALVEAEIEDRGEEPPPAREPRTRVQRSDMALQISKDEIPALPWGYPSELVDVTERLARILHKAGRTRHAALAYQQLQDRSDDPIGFIGEAEAWVAHEDYEAAIRAADAGLNRATAPRSLDLMAMNEEAQRSAVSRALYVRARAYRGGGFGIQAHSDLALAHLFAREVMDDKLAEYLHEVNAPLEAVVGKPYGRGLKWDRAMAAAERSETRDDAVDHVVKAMFLAAVGTRGGMRTAEDPDAYEGVFAPLLMTLARVEAKFGRIMEARRAAAMATLLVGRDQQPWWWAFRGQMHERLGEKDAAFAALAVARGLGVPDLEVSLGETYVGLSGWEAAASALGGAPPETTAPPEGTVTQSVPRQRRPKSGRPGTAPKLGRPFPTFSVETDRGTLSTQALKGRALIITFYREDCGECLQMMPSMGSVARRLKKEGRDTVMIGVSLDDDEQAFQRVYRLGQRWGELVHAPQLGQRFGVQRVPTTWVVDRAGIGRYMVDHWFSTDELESQLRDME
ncbi:MAG: TlpA family protein disulfide reductase [Myxococcales bacterium]|nr:TlpA family protein disulfide reductase [Myxococcales bacterium]